MMKIQILALTAALTALAGCAAAGGSGGDPAAAPPRGEESGSAAPAPSRPAAPPSRPTDDVIATTIVGTVNRGGTGPCYGLVTDDGVQYALYEAKSRALQTGIRISIDASPARLRIDCGAGIPVEVKALAPLR